MHQSGLNVVAVLTRTDAPIGRKRVETPSPVATVAAQLNIPVIHQDIQRAGDNVAQLFGVGLMTIGTFLASYSDLFLDWVFPLTAK